MSGAHEKYLPLARPESLRMAFSGPHTQSLFDLLKVLVAEAQARVNSCKCLSDSDFTKDIRYAKGQLKSVQHLEQTIKDLGKV